MEPSRKCQREVLPLPDNDEAFAEDNDQERTIKHQDLRQEYGHESRHSPLFLSRHTSEEPRIPANSERSNGELKSMVPSFLDDDDEEAFLQMGFRLVAPSTHAPSIPQTDATSSAQQQRPTLARSGTHVTTVKSEPAIEKSTALPLNQGIRPSSTPKQQSTQIQTSTAPPFNQAIRPSSTPKQQSTPTSSARVIKAPREPNEALKRYATSLYAKYDPRRNNVGPLAGKFKISFRIYDAYTLVADPTMTIGNIPTSGVRVDDFLAGKLLMSNYSSKVLHQAWPAEFDHNGMIRATRIPLGHAAKRWRHVGETDIDGKIIHLGQEGWYYDWWRGLHCLMGKEGYDASLYLVRPSWEKFLCEGMTFKIGYKAVVQLPTGDPNDPTPGL
ncbi:MAG: hypothetical protein L6R38_008515 [Xanthoria sp. 2 TBL-2021]|nr:MAG: hypothetical protein L6R38_008515 [Xanthoria sp. 2 TBL-2021]